MWEDILYIHVEIFITLSKAILTMKTPAVCAILPLIICSLFFCGFCQVRASQGGNPIPSMAIFPCKADSGVTVTEVSFITERITLEILRQNLFSVIDKYEIAKRTGKRPVESFDTISNISTYFDMGKVCGADQIIWGTLSRRGNMLLIDLRLGDVSTSQLHSSASTAIVGSTIELSEKILQLLGTLLDLSVTATQSTSASGLPHVVYKPIPQPRPNRLVVRSVPDSAKVFLNEAEVGTTPYVKDSVRAGNYNCRVEKYGYLSFSAPFEVRTSGDKKILVHLDRAFGSLTINSTPPAATVSFQVKGIFGSTPFSCDTLKPGKDTLYLTLNGYGPIKKPITITRKKNDTINVHLFSLKYLDSVKLERRRKNQLVRRIGFGTLAAGFFSIGLIYNNKAADALDRETNAYNAYNQLNSSNTQQEFADAYDKVQTARQEVGSNCKTRNVHYIIAGIFGAGFGISIRF
jgi:hypothetical protein